MRRQPGVLYSETGKCQGTFAVDLRRNEQIVVVFADGDSRVVHVFLRSPQLGFNSTRDLPERLTFEVVVPTKPLDQLQVRDNETGSSWNIENGVAIDGPKKRSTTTSTFCFGLLLSMRDIQPTYPVLWDRTIWSSCELSAYETSDHVADLACRQGALALRGNIICAVTFG